MQASEIWRWLGHHPRATTGTYYLSRPAAIPSMPPYLMMKRRLVWLRSLFSVRWVSHSIWSSSTNETEALTRQSASTRKLGRLKQHILFGHIVAGLNWAFRISTSPYVVPIQSRWQNDWTITTYHGRQKCTKFLAVFIMSAVDLRIPPFRLHCKVSFWLQLTVVNLSTHDDGSDNTSSRQFCKALHNLALRACLRVTKPGNVTKATGCARPACEGTTENDHVRYLKKFSESSIWL